MNTLTNAFATHTSRALIAIAILFGIAMIATPALSSEWVDPNPTTVSFTLYKYVIGDEYPDGEHPSIPDFTFHLDGPISTSMKSGETKELPPGTYILTETSPQGFVLQKWGGDCDEASGTTDSEDSELVVDEDLVSTNVNLSCQVYNEIDENDPPQINGTLVVNKVVINDDDGTNLADDFFFKVNNGTSIAFEADGSNALSVPAGSYTVTEVAAAGYTTSYSGCSGVSVGSASTSICTITNNDIPPGTTTPTTTPQNGTLTVNKVVINDNGGTGTSSDFAFQINGGTTTAFEADGSNTMSLPPGSYTITEVASSSYTTTYSGCTRVDLVASGTATCTITNNDVPPNATGTLVVNKVVINDNSGTGTTSNFSFQVNGGSATAFEVDGSNLLTLSVGTYTITEVAASGYTTSYDNCSSVVVTTNGTTTCTITNNDVPPGDGGGGDGGGGGSGKRISLSDGGGSDNDDDEDEDEPEGEVAGAVAPIGAPNAGMGGAGAGSHTASLATTLMLLLGLAISAATGRRIA